MSTLIVDTCRIENVLPHNNADSLELAVIKGWQCVVKKGAYKVGDLITYIPPYSLLPKTYSDSIGVTQYLKSNGMVRSVKLRGEVSFGIIAPAVAEEGVNVAEQLNITKWEPQTDIRLECGLQAPNVPGFDKYTDMENLRHFPDIFVEGEEVIVTEKIHGTCSRCGIIDGIKYAGSKNYPRAQEPDNLYWLPLKDPSVNKFLDEEALTAQIILLYSEIYGRVQKMQYGATDEAPNAFRAFDIKLNGNYVDHDKFIELTTKYNIPIAPVLYRGPFSLEKIKSLANGPTTLGAKHIREGVVVRPVNERHHRKIGRVLLKYVSDAYLLGNYEE